MAKVPCDPAQVVVNHASFRVQLTSVPKTRSPRLAHQLSAYKAVTPQAAAGTPGRRRPLVWTGRSGPGAQQLLQAVRNNATTTRAPETPPTPGLPGATRVLPRHGHTERSDRTPAVGSPRLPLDRENFGGLDREHFGELGREDFGEGVRGGDREGLAGRDGRDGFGEREGFVLPHMRDGAGGVVGGGAVSVSPPPPPPPHPASPSARPAPGAPDETALLDGTLPGATLQGSSLYEAGRDGTGFLDGGTREHTRPPEPYEQGGHGAPAGYASEHTTIGLPGQSAREDRTADTEASAFAPHHPGSGSGTHSGRAGSGSADSGSAGSGRADRPGRPGGAGTADFGYADDYATGANGGAEEQLPYTEGVFADDDTFVLERVIDPGPLPGAADPAEDAAARRHRAVRHAYYPGRRMNLGVVLLPLRVFLGLISVYAGMGKLCDPVYFDGGERGSMVKWLHSLHPWPLAEPLRDFALAHPVGAGLTIAFLQVFVGVLTILGLWQRFAAAIGALLSAALLVTVSWRTVPAYDAPDIIYLAAWSPLIIAGAPVYSADGRLSSEAWRTLGPRAALWDLRRRVLRRGVLLAAVTVGLTMLVGAVLGGAVRDADRVTVPGPGETPRNQLPGTPLPQESRKERGGSSPSATSPSAESEEPGSSSSSAPTSGVSEEGTGGSAQDGVQSPGDSPGEQAPQEQAPPDEPPAGSGSSGGSGGTTSTGGTGGDPGSGGNDGGGGDTGGGSSGGNSGGLVGGLLG
ncbi:DoxX family protein [Streptomyces sp. SCSIO ZS0520]|uniref:DoxX family protein n=1 Tax=Streptomyces sp. SCSIO ZS0520 TaxID=2892996 RepID=UPI0021D869B1|nr:DoxX family protein [Streptomyces sp. SCSIO ZS0520]